MTRKYSLVIEGEPGSYSACVPELPAILITGQSLDELTARDGEAIGLYWDFVHTDLSRTSMLREIEVKLPWQFGSYSKCRIRFQVQNPEKNRYAGLSGPTIRARYQSQDTALQVSTESTISYVGFGRLHTPLGLIR